MSRRNRGRRKDEKDSFAHCHGSVWNEVRISGLGAVPSDGASEPHAVDHAARIPVDDQHYLVALVVVPGEPDGNVK